MPDIKDAIIRLVKKDLHEDLKAIHKLNGGRNSYIFKLITRDNNEYIAKQYIKRKGDLRDRLSTEYFGLSFLWRNNIRNVPQPLCLNRKNKIGIYSYINGAKIPKNSVSFKDIKKAANFLKSIYLLSHVKDADKQPIASEANFSIRAYIDDIKNRIRTLDKLSNHTDAFLLLKQFIEYEYLPFFRQLLQFIYKECTNRRIDIHKNLARTKQTLSPTDFNFHNAIRQGDKLFFIDFEYYGWDDPAKLIANFFLHPAFPLTIEMREFFYKSVYDFWGKDKALIKRLPLIYLLLSMKWCLIMLNVFRWEDIKGENKKTFYLRQLDRAKKQLSKTQKEYKTKPFPLSLS